MIGRDAAGVRETQMGKIDWSKIKASLDCCCCSSHCAAWWSDAEGVMVEEERSAARKEGRRSS
jgi:hypothetical protein